MSTRLKLMKLRKWAMLSERWDNRECLEMGNINWILIISGPSRGRRPGRERAHLLHDQERHGGPAREHWPGDGGNSAEFCSP